LDIICAKCGKHFSSIESAREHNGHCKGSLKNEELHWIPSPKNKLTPEEWDRLLKAFGRQSIIANPNEETKKNSIDKTHLTTRDNTEKTVPPHGTNKRTKIPKWVIAVMLIVICSLTGLTINLLINELFPITLLIGFSIIFSIDRWFVYYTKKYKAIGILYRIILNLSILSLLGILIWFGINLFSQQFDENVVVSSLIFLAEIVLFIWLWRIVKRNSWRHPSMKLTLLCLIIAFLVFAFAGVEPMATYKNNTIDFFSSSYKQISEFLKKSNNTTTQTNNTSAEIKTNSTTKTTTITSIKTFSTTSILTTIITSTGIDFETGTYKNYYLGLVKSPDGVLSNSYSDFVVLINNKNATNPTYAQLLDFLRSDETDEYPYQYTISLFGFYYGSAESNVDLDIIQNIIDGIEEPNPPRICADFAEMLHNNAEKAGIRCGYVSLDLSDYNDSSGYGIPSDTGHALVVFETTDRGIIYIDDTGNTDSYGPPNNDAIVNVLEVGEEYNPSFLFPSGGWYIPEGEMGIVTDIFITWDGEWN
jgi:hypothetical protein